MVKMMFELFCWPMEMSPIDIQLQTLAIGFRSFQSKTLQNWIAFDWVTSYQSLLKSNLFTFSLFIPSCLNQIPILDFDFLSQPYLWLVMLFGSLLFLLTSPKPNILITRMVIKALRYCLNSSNKFIFSVHLAYLTILYFHWVTFSAHTTQVSLNLFAMIKGYSIMYPIRIC